MTRIFLKLLMAATALVPVAATAQRGPDTQADGRGQWNGQRGGDRGERGGDRGGRGQQQQAPQPAPQQVQQQAQQQQQQQQQQAQRPPRGDFGGGPRGQRGDRQGGDEARRYGDRNPGQGRPGFQAGFQGDRNGRQDYRGPQGYQGQGYQGQGYQGQRDQGQRDYRDQGQRDQGQYRGGYNARQPYADRQHYNERRDFNGGNWNRGWRSDNRYAWSNYRATNRGAYRLPRYYAPGGWSGGYRRFGVGVSLNSILFDQNYWIQDPYTYRLPEAYGPYRWVRYYNDALLVDLDSGRVVDTVYDIFW